MTEKWREALGALGRVQPDESKLRGLTAGGPRLPEPARSGRSRLLAGVVAFAIAAASFAFLVSVFGDRDPVVVGSGSLDPAAICDVPAYDPDVALIAGNATVQYPLSVLQTPGQPAADLAGSGADALRAYLASPAAVHAPADGWRAIASAPDAATFASPYAGGAGEWWVVAFELRPDGSWHLSDEVIADQQPTPAQRGHGLSLRWDGSLVLDGGAWNDPLRLVNERNEAWVDDGGEYWAVAHVFDRTTGLEIVGGSSWISGVGRSYELAPGQELGLPVALGGLLGSLATGTFDVVACVPQLGLASPVGVLEVRSTGAVQDVRVLTYPGRVGEQALATGTLTVENGCMALGSSARPVYVVWPDGYALVERDGRRALIDPAGTEVGALGDRVSLLGAFAELRWVEDMVTGGVPGACRASGESYFVTSGPTSASG